MDVYWKANAYIEIPEPFFDMPLLPAKLYITLLLFVKEGKEDIFQTYEEKVLPILGRYEGELIYRIRAQADSFLHLGYEMPYEIHLLSFASLADFERFKQDDERKAYAYLFQESVRETILIEGIKRL